MSMPSKLFLHISVRLPMQSSGKGSPTPRQSVRSGLHRQRTSGTLPRRSSVSRRHCLVSTRWGKCRQLSAAGPCPYHAHPHPAPDLYYERKVVLGLVQPAASFMTPSELHAVVQGRYRGDGRRIDRYVSFDVLAIDLE